LMFSSVIICCFFKFGILILLMIHICTAYYYRDFAFKI
jgi:hypothetical protein